MDDEILIREMLKRHLEREGVQVLLAPSALHALQLLDEHTVDLVVADQRMPGPSGLLLLQTVADNWPHVGRVILTAVPTPALYRSPVVDTVLDKSEDAAFVVDTITEEARQRHGKRG